MAVDANPRDDAGSGLLPALLAALDALERVGRHLHPPDISALAESVRGVADRVREELGTVRAGASPQSLVESEDPLLAAAAHVALAFDLLTQAAGDSNLFVQAFRAMRESTQAVEALYPLAASSPAVSRFFTEPDLRGDAALAERLAQPGGAKDEVGVLHVENDRASRGGFSLYVPEDYQEGQAYPLIVALHGGSGHGADFLWTWLRECRSRGVILVAPTSRGRTWSLQSPHVDGTHIENVVGQITHRWHVDEERMLLTGMSDGGTFTYATGLRPDSPFTHLAPSSASFHPMLIAGSSPRRMAGLPVYLMHGALDWMFPVDFARTANAALTGAGARVLYREIADLSHTYPRDENPRIMDWFLAPRSG